MIVAFGSPSMWHGARQVRVVGIVNRKGFGPEEIVKTHWEPLCGITYFGIMAPNAHITCEACREELFGED